jgi:hypothetical protein
MQAGTTNWLTCIPAYGRDYNSADAVLVHWRAGKDFLIQDVSCPYNGRYLNKQDAPSNTTFKVRYNQKADFVLIRLVGGVWTNAGVSDAEETSEVIEGLDTDAEEDHGDQS